MPLFPFQSTLRLDTPMGVNARLYTNAREDGLLSVQVFFHNA